MERQPINTTNDSSDTIAMIIEIVFGLFGILGMGWLYAGNIGMAVGAFIGYIIVVFIELAVIGLSLGLAMCITIPINLVIVILSAIRVRDYVRNSGAHGSILYLVLGFVGGAAVLCGGLSLLGGSIQ